ncbi:MAG TPA: copper homeostasis protein CutC [Victivallales bacterium]|nr:copper homeostasis protein CutC [Victivallales bacterium]
MADNIKLEVCLDNIESILTAAKVGVDRLELCGSLAVGGITPSAGLIKYAKDNTNISLHPMIRTRAGDFCFNSEEIKAMANEIQIFSDLGADGVVIGLLNDDFTVNLKATELLCNIAKKNNLCVTFHRAIDFAKDYIGSVRQLSDLGVNRILTSGQADTAIKGIDKISLLNESLHKKIDIMAGSGVNASNVVEILERTKVINVHCSASSKVNRFADCKLKLGSSSSDLEYQITDEQKLTEIKNKVSCC